jgi:hypothetical protein
MGRRVKPKNDTRDCDCSCGGCNGAHGLIDHCYIERFGCYPKDNKK